MRIPVREQVSVIVIVFVIIIVIVFVIIFVIVLDEENTWETTMNCLGETKPPAPATVTYVASI